MSSVVDELVNMGFDRSRAEHANSVSGAGLEEAMEWLIAHADEEIPTKPSTSNSPILPSSSISPTEETILEAETSSPVASFQCQDCGELILDEYVMRVHATKYGHENFSESKEVVEDISDETAIQMAIDDTVGQKENQAKEKQREDPVVKVQDASQVKRDAELRAMVDDRKRMKIEELEAKQRILARIQLDKEERKARQAGVEPPKAVPASVTPPPKVDYSQATIQVRLLSGQCVKKSFESDEKLSSVRHWLALENPSAFNLMTPFPRKTFTDDDYEKTLKELGLLPSASITMSPVEIAKEEIVEQLDSSITPVEVAVVNTNEQMELELD